MLKKLIAVICFAAMLTMTAQAMPNWLSELQERVENSPMEATSLQLRSLVNGVIEQEEVLRGNEGRTTVRLYSNLRNMDYALYVEVHNRWTNMEMDILFNPQRTALRFTELGDETLGVTFASFEADLRSFLNSLYSRGLSSELPPAAEFEMIINYVAMFVEFLNSDVVLDVNPLQFADLFLLLMLRAQQETGQVTINSGGEDVDVQRVSVSIGADTIIDVLINLIDRVDTNISDWLAQGIADIRSGLVADRAYAQGSVTVVTYTDQAGRTRRINISLESYDTFADSTRGAVSIDFGAHVADVWVIETVNIDSWSTTTNVVVWEVPHTSELRVHKFTVTETTFNQWMTEPRTSTMVMTYAWNPATGHLTVTVKEEGRFGTFEDIIEGSFTLSDSGFVLILGDEEFSMRASAQVGTPVPRPAFINLDRWADVAAIRELFAPQTRMVISPIIETPLPPMEITIEFPQPEPPPPITIEFVMVPEITFADETIVLSPVKVVANCHYLYLRRGPGVSFAAFNHLPAGYVVNVLEVRGNWVKVSTSRGTGWVFGRYLEFYGK